MTSFSISAAGRGLILALGLIASCAAAAVRIDAPVPFPNEPDPQAMADGAKLPKLVKSVEPAQPAEAASLQRDVRVNVAFVVTAQGKVTRASAMFEPPAPFAEAALAAVRQWEFEPGLHYFTGSNRMVAVATQMTVLITFPAATAESAKTP